MAATISANSAGGGGLVSSGDASGVLALQTKGVTALSISTAQVVTLVNALGGTPSAPTAAVNTSTTQLATTAFANPASLLSANGYVKLPSGVIMQWGSATASAATSGTSTVVTFPLAFPTGLTFASAVCNFAVVGTSAWNLTASTTTTMTLQRSNNASTDTGTAFKWFAIGY